MKRALLILLFVGCLQSPTAPVIEEEIVSKAAVTVIEGENCTRFQVESILYAGFRTDMAMGLCWTYQFFEYPLQITSVLVRPQSSKFWHEIYWEMEESEKWNFTKIRIYDYRGVHTMCGWSIKIGAIKWNENGQ